MDEFTYLPAEDRDKLLLAPVYIALLAATFKGEMDDEEKAAIHKLTHVKTYCSPEGLAGYYQQVEQVFDEQYARLDEVLPKDPTERKTILEFELAGVESLIAKLQPDMADRLQKSLNDFSRHAFKVRKNIVEDFIFPVDIKGLTA